MSKFGVEPLARVFQNTVYTHTNAQHRTRTNLAHRHPKCVQTRFSQEPDLPSPPSPPAPLSFLSDTFGDTLTHDKPWPPFCRKAVELEHWANRGEPRRGEPDGRDLCRDSRNLTVIHICDLVFGEVVT